MDIMHSEKVESPSQEVTILLVDDQPAVRFGLQLFFQFEIEMLRFWEAGSSAEALALMEGLRPDVVLMDVDLPDRDGISATRQLTTLWPHCLVIILTIHGQPEVKAHALAAGAWGFVEKGQPEELRTALRQAIHQVTSEPRLSPLG